MVEALQDTKNMTAEMVQAVTDQLKAGGYELGEPLVAEVSLGSTLRSLKRSLKTNGLRISYDRDLVLDSRRQLPRQLIRPKIEVVYFERTLDCGYVNFFDTEEEDKLRSLWGWDPVPEWQRRNVELEIEKLPSILGRRWGPPIEGIWGQILIDYLHRTGKLLLPDRLVWMADLYKSTRNGQLKRHLVMKNDKDGIYVSSSPFGVPDGAGLAVVSYPENVALSRGNLTLVKSQG